MGHHIFEDLTYKTEGQPPKKGERVIGTPLKRTGDMTFAFFLQPKKLSSCFLFEESFKSDSFDKQLLPGLKYLAGIVFSAEREG